MHPASSQWNNARDGTNDPYGPTLFEAMVDNVVEFFGSLLGVRAVINRPLHFYEPGKSVETHPRNDASAWRREKKYREVHSTSED